MSAKINAKRLLKLADYLETVPPKNFDMARWGTTAKVDDCGFAGCAAGWAAHGRLFQGFYLVARNSFFQKTDPQYRPRGAKRASKGFAALQRLFGISCFGAMTLFTESRKNETPKQVSKRIRKFVRENAKAGA